MTLNRFASMFPDKIGRMVVDGVSNPHDYYNGTVARIFCYDRFDAIGVSGNYTGNLVDSEQALTNIYEACFEAGPSACAIYENSTDLIRARVSKLLDSIHQAPLPFYNDSDPSNIQFTTVDYTLVTQTLGQVMQTPYELAPAFAEAVVELEQGNGSLIFQSAPGIGIYNAQQNDFSCDSSLPQPFSTGGLEIYISIACGDRVNPGASGIEASLLVYEKMIEISPFWGPMWFVESSGPCA